MVKFARECLQQMHILRERLVPILGDDTKDLDMRFGLHSGPVTGGVLRGDKSRFQLFGDTMNTAARMESNGERGRIHISPDTKDLLHRAGKAHWVQAREDKITAKGKGGECIESTIKFYYGFVTHFCFTQRDANVLDYEKCR